MLLLFLACASESSDSWSAPSDAPLFIHDFSAGDTQVGAAVWDTTPCLEDVPSDDPDDDLFDPSPCCPPGWTLLGVAALGGVTCALYP